MRIMIAMGGVIITRGSVVFRGGRWRGLVSVRRCELRGEGGREGGREEGETD